MSENSSSTGVPINAFYDAYKDYGVVPLIAIPYTIIVFCAIIGAFGNINVLVSTIRNKSLHGNCNYLLAFNAICDSWHQTAHILFGYIVYSGTNFIPFMHCMAFQTFPLMGVHLSITATLAIGIDRLLSVVFPMQ
ncbi:Protein SRSX-29 [Aphelenchoides avenae]|nr:Protein SRSX-29 [Aphelenchus avenae]